MLDWNTFAESRGWAVFFDPYPVRNVVKHEASRCWEMSIRRYKEHRSRCYDVRAGGELFFFADFLWDLWRPWVELPGIVVRGNQKKTPRLPPRSTVCILLLQKAGGEEDCEGQANSLTVSPNFLTPVMVASGMQVRMRLLHAWSLLSQLWPRAIYVPWTIIEVPTTGETWGE